MTLGLEDLCGVSEYSEVTHGQQGGAEPGSQNVMPWVILLEGSVWNLPAAWMKGDWPPASPCVGDRWVNSTLECVTER